MGILREVAEMGGGGERDNGGGPELWDQPAGCDSPGVGLTREELWAQGPRPSLNTGGMDGQPQDI